MEALGAAGMSSDESEIEDGQKVYFSKKMSWRKRELVSRMTTIERDRNFSNCYGNVSGNSPRARKRRLNATETSRKAPPGLPINFYDEGWYEGLNERQKEALGAKPPLDFLEFQRME